MATEKSATLEFVCTRCEARLNVKALLAGKKINCPKCHKKIVVPLENHNVAGLPEKQAKKLSEPAGEAEMCGVHGSVPVKAVADEQSRRLAEIEDELQQKKDRLAQRDRELEKLRADLEQQRLRHEELSADLEKTRAERRESCEKAAAKQAEKEPENNKGTVEGGFHAEDMERSSQRIADLERQVAEARREADMARARAAAGAVSGDGETRDDGYGGPDPDRLIADLQGSTLRRGLRISLVAHAVLLVFTSLGFVYWGIRGGRPQPQVDDAAEAPAAPERMEPEAPPPPADPAVETEESPSAEDRPLTEIERRIEALPEPGEVPTPSEITLDLD